jgi:hypothetical protein
MKKLIHKLILIKTLLLNIILFKAPLVFAQTTEGLENPISSDTFADLIKNIANIVVKVGIPLIVVFLVYSGFLFVTAAGNEEKMAKAKNNFFWAIVGGAIIIGAYAIAEAIVQFAKTL